MTISLSANRWTYTGNGVTTDFPYGSRIFEPSDLKVYVGGALRMAGSDYEIAGAGEAGGGTVTFVEAPADGAGVTLVREVPATQGLDLAALGSFPAEENEKALDRLTILVQQLADGAARSLRQPNDDAAAIAALPDRAARATKLLSFDANGDPVAAAVNATILTAGTGIALPGTTITLDIDGLDEDTAPSAAGDFVATWDVSANAHRKVRLQNLTGGSVEAQSASFAAGAGTPGRLFVCTDTLVATLPAAADVPFNYRLQFKNQTDGKSVVVQRTGSDTIDGGTSLRVPARSLVEVTRTSSGEWTVTILPAHQVGEVLEWTTNTLPEGGWAWTNGQALNRTAYSGLFAVWGTTYGTGDGSTTFGVRDDRGRVKAGKDNMGGASAASRLTTGGAGIDGATLGASGGAQTHTLSPTEMPSHSHSGAFYVSDSTGAGSDGGGAIRFGGNGNTGNTGNGQAHPNTQPTIIANYIVKT
jgi:microcystin-dependent protein